MAKHVDRVDIKSPYPVCNIQKSEQSVPGLPLPDCLIIKTKIDKSQKHNQHHHKPRHKAQYPSHIKFPDADRALSLIFLQKEQRNEKAAQHKKNINPDKCARKPLNPCMKQKNKDNGNTAYCIERRILL